MTDFVIKKVAARPVAPFDKNTLYFIKGEGESDMEIMLSSADGATARSLVNGTPEDVMTVSPTAPDLTTTDQPFWWDSNSGTLFVRYNDGTSTQWVEAIQSPLIPQFGPDGQYSGKANTMSRSDHTHGSLDITADW